MIISGTGHRPYKLGGYCQLIFDDLVEFIEIILSKLKPRTVITGLALGFDKALAQAVINLNIHQSKFSKIKLIGAIPFIGQENAWPIESRNYYNELLSKCDQIHIISSGDYDSAKMMIRNKWMVDNSNLLLSLHDGSSGGTNNCVNYAKSKGKSIINLWSEYQAYLKNKYT